MSFKNRIKKITETKLGKLILKIFFTVFFLGVLAVLLLILIDKTILNFYVTSRKNTEVPYIAGLTLEEASNVLKEKKLKWNTVGNGKYVVKTEPQAGILVKEGRIIHLYLSDNPRVSTP